MNNRRLMLIRILMVTSHLVLSAFVVYWLTGRFHQEKEILRKDLSIAFQQAQDKALDSALMRKVIDPILLRKEGKSLQTRDTLIYTGDQNKVRIALKDSITVNIRQTDTRKNPARDTVPHVNVIYQTVQMDGSKERIMIQGVKLLAGITGDSTDSAGPGGFPMLPGADTSLVKRFFSRSVGDRFALEWTAADSGIPDAKPVSLVFTSGWPGNELTVVVKQYRPYLYRRMLPNAAFALILLSLTGTAFVISFRSLKKQTLLTQMRNDFVGNITHELKTPVATIKVALEAIRKYGAHTDRRRSEEYLDIVSTETERLDALISGVLATAMYEEKHDWIHLQAVTFSELAEDLRQSLEARLMTEDAKLDITIEGNPVQFTGDPLHIRGALLNLVDNSLKYGGRGTRIGIRMVASGSAPVISVWDDGPGIPDAYRNRVFDRFFRVPSGNVHNVKGYGLGLSYVKAVMKQHGGQVDVRNNTGKGCTFTLRFG